MFETFDHTADLGLRIRAKQLDELFAEAGRGLTSILVDNPEAIRPEEEASIEIDGTQRDYLLFDWLTELLFRYETQNWLGAEFSVTVHETGLRAALRGESIDPRRHQVSHEVKAITYHRLKVQQDEQGWLAEVIVDI